VVLFKQANETRAYVETVRASKLATVQDSFINAALDLWCAWASAEADRLDPIKSGRFRFL